MPILVMQITSENDFNEIQSLGFPPWHMGGKHALLTLHRIRMVWKRIPAVNKGGLCPLSVSFLLFCQQSLVFPIRLGGSIRGNLAV